MNRLKDRVAVITGGNSGISLSTAKHRRLEGARVAIAGRSRERLDEATKALGHGVPAIQAEVVGIEELDRLFLQVTEKLGRIDILFVNAGIATFASIAETSENAFDKQFDVNVRGAYFTIQKALPVLNDGVLDRSEHQRCSQQRSDCYQRLLGYPGGPALAHENGGGVGGPRHPRKRGCSRTNLQTHLAPRRALPKGY